MFHLWLTFLNDASAKSNRVSQHRNHSKSRVCVCVCVSDTLYLSCILIGSDPQHEISALVDFSEIYSDSSKTQQVHEKLFFEALIQKIFMFWTQNVISSSFSVDLILPSV